MCACAARTSGSSRTASVADKSVDRLRFFLGFAFGVADVGVAGFRVDVGVDVAVDVAVGAAVSAGGEVGVMAAIGVAAGVEARVGMKLVFIAQI